MTEQKTCEIERFTSHSYTETNEDGVFDTKQDEVIYCWRHARHSLVVKSFTTETKASSHVIERRGIFRLCAHRKVVYRLCNEHFNFLYEELESPGHIDTKNDIADRRVRMGTPAETSRFRFRKNRL